MKTERVLSKCLISCYFKTFSYILEKVLRTLTGRKFLSTVLFGSPLPKGQTAAFLHHLESGNFECYNLLPWLNCL